MAAGDPVLWSLYVYAPVKGVPIVFTIAYAISTAFHTWQCYRYKAFKLVGLHPLCGIMFTAGYALREYGAYNYKYSYIDNTPLIVFICSQVFIYICPPLLELVNYHVLGRLFYYVPFCSPFPPSKVLATFGGLMLIVETLNSLGVSFSTNATSSRGIQEMGGHLSITAIVLQLAIILIFVGLAGKFHWRCMKADIHTRSVKTTLLTLYASMALIFIRCIYRLVEHTGNVKIELDDIDALKELSPILRYEAFFYIFEATLMLLNTILWNVWHPGRFLPKGNHVFLGPDGNEVVGEEHSDDRPLLAKTASTLTFGLLFRKKGGAQRFQELDEYAAGSRGRHDEAHSPGLNS